MSKRFFNVNQRWGSILFFGKGIFLGALSLNAFTGFSQADSAKTPSLNETIVSASRNEQKTGEVGRSVTVITAEEIKGSVYNNVAELLTQQAGIYSVGAGQTPGSLQNIYMRGANSNQTVIMMDGVRITDPSSVDNAIDLSELSLANIERIEIVRGSHSTMYGSSAIGGVVNIITKKDQSTGFNADAVLKTGTFGSQTFDLTENLFLNYTHKSGLYANAEIFNTNVKGINATVDTAATRTFAPDQDGFDKTDLLGKIGFKSNKWDVYTSYKRTDQKADIDDGAFTDDDNYTIDFKRNLFTYGAARKVNEQLSFNFSGGYSDMQRISVDDSSVVEESGITDHSYFEGNYAGSTLNNELQANLQLKNINLLAGGGAYKEAMTFRTFYENSAWNYTSKQDLDTLDLEATTLSWFLHANINGGILSEKLKHFKLVLGTRGNRHSTFGNNLTYEINPSYEISDNSLIYASYTTGFNAPSLYRLFVPNKNFTSGITRGNSTLNPETSSSYEIGFKQVTEKVSFGISFFHTVVDNAIDYVYLWDKNIPIDSLGADPMRSDYRGDTYLNIGRQTAQGIEFNIYSRLTDKIEVSGNFSMVSGRLDYSPELINTDQTQGHHVQVYANGAYLNKEVQTFGLVRRPNTVNLALTYKPINKLKLSTDIRYVGARSDIKYDITLGPYGALANIPLGDYMLVGLTGKYNVNRQLSAVLRLDNIFNVQYSEIRGYSARGRGIYLSVRYALAQ